MVQALQIDVMTGEQELVEVVLPPPSVPELVYMRQARRALLAAGLLDQVDAAIAAMPLPQRQMAQIDWEFAIEVRRDSDLVATLAGALGLSQEQVDALFIAAAAL